MQLFRHLQQVHMLGDYKAIQGYGWLVVWNINSIFPYIGFLIIPIDFHIFQRGLNHQPGMDDWVNFSKKPREPKEPMVVLGLKFYPTNIGHVDLFFGATGSCSCLFPSFNSMQGNLIGLCPFSIFCKQLSVPRLHCKRKHQAENWSKEPSVLKTLKHCQEHGPLKSKGIVCLIFWGFLKGMCLVLRCGTILGI